ncbi:MAG: lysophospholipid acyltransferase family protein [Actinomycetota bacterium]
MAPTIESEAHPPTIDGVEVGATNSNEARRIDPSRIDPAIIGSWAGGLRIATGPLRRRWLDIEVVGKVNVPTEGAAIIAANHLSFIDSPLLMTELGRRVTFLGKAEYLRGRVTRTVFPRVGMIPVDRSGRSVAWSLKVAEERLASGECVGVFPEGSRSRDGHLHRGHVGAAHLALRTGAPIIPVGIIGSAAAMPVGNRMPVHRGRIIVRVGAPIGLGEYLGRPRTAATKQALTDQVMSEIAALSGQAVVDDFLTVTG